MSNNQANENNTPDNIVPHPNVLPYGSNIGAPAIKSTPGLGVWKQSAIHGANKHYKNRYDELVKQFKALAEEFKWNDIIYNARFSFKPVIGNVYHLYQQDDSSYYLSLFAPHERVAGDQGYQGAFRLNYDNRWEPA